MNLCSGLATSLLYMVQEHNTNTYPVPVPWSQSLAWHSEMLFLDERQFPESIKGSFAHGASWEAALFHGPFDCLYFLGRICFHFSQTGTEKKNIMQHVLCWSLMSFGSNFASICIRIRSWKLTGFQKWLKKLKKASEKIAQSIFRIRTAQDTVSAYCRRGS